MLKFAKISIVSAVATILTAACSSVDCPLNNRVYAKFRFAGTVAQLEDTLTVSTPRTIDNVEEDTVLVNRLTNADSLSLPMSYARNEDMYFFSITQRGTGLQTVDTVWVDKENNPHFESVDCNPAFFHTINGVKFTQHAIDDIKVNNNKVTYNDAKAHFLIYLKDRGN